VRSSEDPDDALSSVLAGLAVSARQANLARSDVLAHALLAVAEGRLTEAQRAAAQQAAHQVVGSAGTFGVHRASELAGSLEEYFATDEAARAEGLVRAQAQLDEVRRELLADHQVEE
jgi:HPt (histidine-containing phosphotransfer) domain-containing protein